MQKTLQQALREAAERRALIRRRAQELGVPIIDIKMSSCPVSDIRGIPRRNDA